jgi:DNA-binding NarL/FixJ family response regulator
MIRILLVDDQTLLCEVLKTWLEVEEDFQVIGVAHNGNEAISKIELLHPDIVLMDIDMPEMDGLNATQIISQHYPEVKVIFLSGHDEDDYLGKSLRSGAKGYLLKNTTAEELADKVRQVYHNHRQIAPSADGKLVAAFQTQLEDLIETYRHKFQKQLEKGERTETLLAQYDTKFNEIKALLDQKQEIIEQIKAENQINWESIQQEISNVHTQYSSANRNLSTQFNQQIANLKKDLDTEFHDALDEWSRQRAALQEWAVQKDQMQVSTEEFQSQYRRELTSTINPFRASLRDVDRKMQTMRNWLIGSVLLAAMSLTFSGWMLISNTSNNSSSEINDR